MKQHHNIDKPTTRWIRNFLSNRTAVVSSNGVESHTLNFRTGTPQGTILGPMCWLIFINELPKIVEDAGRGHTKSTLYADDFTCASLGLDQDECMKYAIETDRVIKSWANQNNMIISSKTETIALKSGTDTVPPPKLCDYKQDTLSKPPKLLGTTIDRTLRFHKHVHTIIATCKKRLSVLNRIAGASFGPSDHTMRILYKSTIEPILLYGSPVYQARISARNRFLLETLQLQAARLITGLPLPTDTQSTLLEAGLEPLSDIAQHKHLSTYERFKRYEGADYRKKKSRIPVYPPIPHNARATTKTLMTPRLQALQQINTLINTAQSLEPNLVLPPYPPESTGNVRFITFGIDTDIIVPAAPNNAPHSTKKQVERERLAANISTLKRLKKKFGSKSKLKAELWTDASVSPTRSQDRTVGACVSKVDGSIKILYRLCGKDACSYRAEALTIESSVEWLLHLVIRHPKSWKGKHVLLGTDSRSTVAELSTSPITQRNTHSARIWAHMIKLADYV
eukprot:Tbor_TRINITY_DN5543_c0_g1::TRINITY_DN5543_c0_g1_i3::g.12639::m.12639